MVAMKPLGLLEIDQQQFGFGRRIIMFAKPIDNAALIVEMTLPLADMTLGHFKLRLSRDMRFGHVSS